MIRKPNFKLNWKYALGELVLIFLGISLAITFQNWNEGRKMDNLKFVYYDRLLIDLESDNEQIDLLFQEAYGYMSIHNSVDSIMKINGSQDETQKLILESIMNLGYFEFFAHTDTYDDLVASGNLKVLDEEIRSDLVSLSNLHVKFTRYEEGNNSLAFDMMNEIVKIQPFYEVNDSWRKFIGPTSPDGRVLLFNFLKTKKGADERAITRYKEVKELNNKLIVKINSLKK